MKGRPAAESIILATAEEHPVSAAACESILTPAMYSSSSQILTPVQVESRPSLETGCPSAIENSIALAECPRPRGQQGRFLNCLDLSEDARLLDIAARE